MIYNLVLRSSTGTQVNGDNSSMNYNVNWGFLQENKKYKLSWSFQSRNYASLTGDSQYLLYIDTFLNQVYETTSTSTGYLNSKCLGIIHPETFDKSGSQGLILSAKCYDNPYVVMNGISGNILNVSIKNIDGTIPNISTTQYVIILSFEEI